MTGALSANNFFFAKHLHLSITCIMLSDHAPLKTLPVQAASRAVESCQSCDAVFAEQGPASRSTKSMGLWFRPSGARHATTGGRPAAPTVPSVTTVWRNLTITALGWAPALAWYASRS